MVKVQSIFLFPVDLAWHQELVNKHALLQLNKLDYIQIFCKDLALI